MQIGSIKIARSRTQLKTAQPVCIANVFTHLVRSEVRLDQLTAGFEPHANISKKRNTTVHMVTRMMRVQLT